MVGPGLQCSRSDWQPAGERDRPGRSKGNEETEEAERLNPWSCLAARSEIEPLKKPACKQKEHPLLSRSGYTIGDPRLRDDNRIVRSSGHVCGLEPEKKTKTGTASATSSTNASPNCNRRFEMANRNSSAMARATRILVSLARTQRQNPVVDRLVDSISNPRGRNDRQAKRSRVRAASRPAQPPLWRRRTAKASMIGTEADRLQQKRAQLLVDNTEEWP